MALLIPGRPLANKFYNYGVGLGYHIPPSLCDYHLFSFPRTVTGWNILPEAVVRASSGVFRGKQPNLYSGTTPTILYLITMSRTLPSGATFQLLFVALVA